jgi:uncharacterized membrane protein (DUF485 family)
MQHTAETRGIGRRLRRVAWLSLAGLAPYAAFIALLSLDPAAMGARPFGGAVSLAIWLALFLFAWPVIVAILYLRGIEDGGTP